MPWKVGRRTGVRAGSRWPHLKSAEEGDYLPYPFFLGYASALLKREGFDAKLIDAIAEGTEEDAFISNVSQLHPDLLFIETSAPSLEYDMRIANELKKSTNAKIAISAPSMELSEKFLIKHTYIDFILFSEYEFTLLELAKRLSEKKRNNGLSEIDGLIYREGSKIIKNKARPLCDLDALPWPDRDDVPIKKYLDSPGEMPLPCAQMLASRGCPFHCIFCAWPQLTYGGHNYRTRSVSDVVDEMEFLIKKMGFKSIYFDDDTFNIGKDRMLQLCEEIKNRKLNVPWAVMARPDLMDEEILRAMKAAGLWAIKYGVESGSQKILDNAKKQLNLELAKRNILLTKKIGIRTHLTFTFGLPGETLETIKQTEKLLYELDPFSAQFSIATPFPGTEFYKQYENEGKIISNELYDYNGSIKSVIRTEALSSFQLENAVMHIEQAWYAHCKKRNRTPKTFLRITKENGIIYSIHKLASFLKGKTGIFPDLFKPTHPNSQIAKVPPSFYDPTKANTIVPINFDFNQRFGSADILLIMSPPWGMFPPLNLAYLSSYLKSKGYKAGILDMNIELFNNASLEDKKWWHVDAYPYWVNQKLFPELMKKFEPKINKYVDSIINTGISTIGFTVHFGNRPFAIEIAKRIKERDSKRIIIFGGPGTFTRHDREEYIPKGVGDIFVVGEGEETLYEIVKALKNGDDVRKIAGAVAFDGKNFSELIPRRYIKNLDDIPFPTFEELNLSKYPINDEALPLLFSRGCISRCTFCNDWSLAGIFRMRSGDNMFKEVKYHVEHNKISNFYFNDLLINGNIKNLERFCDLVIDSGLKISWSTSAIAKKDMTYEVLLKLRKSGCQALIYGIESGSNTTLKRMGKLFTAEGAEQVIQDTYRAGIKVVINIIVGFPGETEQNYYETVDFLKRNAKYLHMIGSLNTLCINLSSTLDTNQEKYGIIMETEEDKRASTWHTNQGENYETRLMRGNELLNILKKLNLAVCTTNVPRDIVKVPK